MFCHSKFYARQISWNIFSPNQLLGHTFRPEKNLATRDKKNSSTTSSTNTCEEHTKYLHTFIDTTCLKCTYSIQMHSTISINSISWPHVHAIKCFRDKTVNIICLQNDHFSHRQSSIDWCTWQSRHQPKCTVYQKTVHINFVTYPNHMATKCNGKVIWRK